MSPIDALLDAADVGANESIRLDGLRALLDAIDGRPIPAPRWRILERRINAELRRRAEIEGRSPIEVFSSEVESALALAAPKALHAATIAFLDRYKDEVRREAGDLVLEAILGDWRRSAESARAITSHHANDSDPLIAAHAARLLIRLPALAELTTGEMEALSAEIAEGHGSSARRVRAHRARTKARRAITKKDR